MEPFCEEFETIDQLMQFVEEFAGSGAVTELHWNKVTCRAWGVGETEDINNWLNAGPFED